MEADAEAAQAEGTLGAQVSESSHGWVSHLIEYFAIGTAVASISDEQRIEPPLRILPLTD